MYKQTTIDAAVQVKEKIEIWLKNKELGNSTGSYICQNVDCHECPLDINNAKKCRGSFKNPELRLEYINECLEDVPEDRYNPFNHFAKKLNKPIDNVIKSYDEYINEVEKENVDLLTEVSTLSKEVANKSAINDSLYEKVADQDIEIGRKEGLILNYQNVLKEYRKKQDRTRKNIAIRDEEVEEILVVNEKLTEELNDVKEMYTLDINKLDRENQDLYNQSEQLKKDSGTKEIVDLKNEICKLQARNLNQFNQLEKIDGEIPRKEKLIVKYQRELKTYETLLREACESSREFEKSNSELKNNERHWERLCSDKDNEIKILKEELREWNQAQFEMELDSLPWDIIKTVLDHKKLVVYNGMERIENPTIQEMTTHCRERRAAVKESGKDWNGAGFKITENSITFSCEFKGEV